MVVFPLLAIFVATISISFVAYARTVLLDATIEGARYAALADQNIESGIAKTSNMVRDSIGQAISITVTGEISKVGVLESVRFVSRAAFSLVPGATIIEVSSVATRELSY
jgi:uncharacterized protein YfaP (DUF2135 family)